MVEWHSCGAVYRTAAFSVPKTCRESDKSPICAKGKTRYQNHQKLKALGQRWQSAEICRVNPAEEPDVSENKLSKLT